MRKVRTPLPWVGIVALTINGVSSCNQQQANITSPSTEKDTGKQDMINRGAYLVTIGACSDCHSPKNFTNLGPVVDSSRYLAGHPADSNFLPLT